MSNPPLVLASKSKARKAMLEAAGITVDGLVPNVDEEALKRGFKAGGVTACDIANALAEAKALGLSRSVGSATLVLGGDQVLALEDGSMLDKPSDKADAKAHLKKLSGAKHKLFSAAAIADHGSVIWSHTDIATMTVRTLTDEFIDNYVESEWEHIRHCVGCYEIEGRGVQLFSDVEGSQFTIMGLPLLPLIGFLRAQGVMPS